MPEQRIPRPGAPASPAADPAFRRYAATIAVYATALYGAVVIAAFGVLALFSGTDVIAGPDVFGPMASVVLAAAAIVCVFVLLLVIALTVPRADQRVGPLRAIAIGVAAYLAYAVVGPLLAGVIALDPLIGVVMAGSELLSPYALLAGVAALVVTLLYMLVLASRVGERGRPQWPWEKDGDDRDDSDE